MLIDQIVQGGAADGQEFGGLTDVVGGKKQGLLDTADFSLVACFFEGEELAVGLLGDGIFEVQVFGGDDVAVEGC